MTDRSAGARTPVAGVVLVGGGSRRLGIDKATLPIDGVPLACRVAEVLRAAGCDPVVGVGRDVHDARTLGALIGLDVVADAWPGAGPLGGVLTAVERFADRDVLVAACDLPALDVATVDRLLAVDEPADVVVARSDRVQPVLACWRRSATDLLRAAFADGERSLVGALARLRVVEVGVDATAVVDVDTPDDLRRWTAGG